jgi:secreted Zn-dependent insulinase-like peptidase
MCLIITPTAKGLEQWQKILDVIFQYVKMLREKGAQKWIHDELERTKETDWIFQNKAGAGGRCIALSQSLGDVAMFDV